MIPGDGYLPACVPAVVDTWAASVARFGTMSFSQILQPAIELAENGYPVYERLHYGLRSYYSQFTEVYPTTGEVYYPKGRPPEIGEVLRNPDYAETLKVMCRAEKEHQGEGRIKGIEAARDAFYKGPIAERIVDFITKNPVEDASGSVHFGILSYEDMAGWNATVEEPASLNYRGLEVPQVPHLDAGASLPATTQYPGRLRPGQETP